MSDHEKAQTEVTNLLAELDAEFGRKPGKGKAVVAPHKALNAAFHANNPIVKLSGARGQLDKMRFDNYYDWERHRQAIIDANLDELQQAGEETLQWLPEARVTYIINQHCASCAGVTQFCGHEYIRFRGRHRYYKALAPHPDARRAQWGETVVERRETHPTMLKKVGEVDGNLLAFGIPPNGDPLPDLTEEMDETVSRCPGCINLERKALDMWISVTQPSPQTGLDLEIEIPLSTDGT